MTQALGKYNLVRHLATGGMAEIWLAEQEGPGGFNKQLVIKRILPHLARDEHFTQMFFDEARTVAHLAHPNIGQVFELGEIDGEHFIAMEYIEGLDLSVVLEKTLERGEQMPILIALRILSDVLQALEYAHNFTDRTGQFIGLVHRDVTPQNVLVSNDGVIKLVDFGVAKAKANQSKTQSGAIKGKFAYMAPEQIEQGALDRRVDLFAVGVMLYELLTGTKPFGEDLFAVNAILNTEPTDIRELRPGVPQSLVNIMTLALSKAREGRYQSAAAMAEDLEEFMRVTGKFVTQRDVADYVRMLQGIEAPSTAAFGVQTGPRARITEIESPIQTPGPMPQLQAPTSPASPVKTPGSGAQKAVTGAVEALASAPEEARRNIGLILVFTVVLFGIVGAAGLAGYLALTREEAPKDPPKAVTKKTTPPPKEPAKKDAKKDAGPAAQPRALYHADGGLVLLDAASKSRLHYKGKYLGTTPFQTSLRQGSYKLMVERDGKKTPWTIEVKNKMGMQSFKAK